MARQATSMKKTRTRYSQVYKDEALVLADRVGASAAARELGLQPSQLYQWRAKAQQQQSASVREQALAEENARLKRQLAEKSEELEIAKKAAVRSTGHRNTATRQGTIWQDEDGQEDSPQTRSSYSGSSGKQVNR